MKRSLIKDIARQRIARLLRFADEVVSINPEIARGCVEEALAIAKRCRVRIPRSWRRRICKKCHSLLKPGVNCRVRLRKRRSPHLAITCLNCGYIARYHYK